MYTPIFDAIRSADPAGLEQLLDDNPALSEAVDEQGVSALLIALYLRHPEMAHAIARRKAALSIHEASALGDLERAGRLLAEESEAAKSFTPDGFTALHLASYFGHPDVVRLLLAHGASVQIVARNQTRVQPLHSAVAGRNIDVVRLLLEASADPNARQAGGFTPLMGAAAAGATEICDLLLAAGADGSLLDDEAKTALDLAREKGHLKTASRLGA